MSQDEHVPRQSRPSSRRLHASLTSQPRPGLEYLQCFDKKSKYYFCPKCGVRCFTFGGESENVVVDLTDLGGGDGNGGKMEIWRAKWDGEEATTPYLSVNGTTIEPSEVFDLRVLTEQKRVQYFDDRSEPEEKKKEARWDRPHYGGCY